MALPGRPRGAGAPAAQQGCQTQLAAHVGSINSTRRCCRPPGSARPPPPRPTQRDSPVQQREPRLRWRSPAAAARIGRPGGPADQADLTAQQAGQLLADGQPQAGAAIASAGRTVGLLKRSKIAPCLASGMPIPLSRTVRHTNRRWRRVGAQRHGAVFSELDRKLARKFFNTCRTSSTSVTDAPGTHSPMRSSKCSPWHRTRAADAGPRGPRPAPPARRAGSSRPALMRGDRGYCRSMF